MQNCKKRSCFESQNNITLCYIQRIKGFTNATHMDVVSTIGKAAVLSEERHCAKLKE